jgi:hypothetical protein
MSDDLVTRAARALRESHGGGVADPAAARRRLLAASATQRTRRLRLVAVAVPLAAVLALSTAFAAGRVRQLFAELFASPVAETSVSSVVPRPPVPPSLPSPPATPSTASIADDDDDAGAGDGGAPPVVPPRGASSVARAPAGGDAGASADDGAEATLYAAAHRAHFVSHDPGAALAAWDAYLAAYPNGRFALEARYNRALSLVRLGRLAEARAALAPFADGTAGGYRRREARELLDALDGKDAG